jgi:hypothetical protein
MAWIRAQDIAYGRLTEEALASQWGEAPPEKFIAHTSP